MKQQKYENFVFFFFEKKIFTRKKQKKEKKLNFIEIDLYADKKLNNMLILKYSIYLLLLEILQDTILLKENYE